jgi:cytochrome c oxidase assembly protein subunit 11
VDVNRWVTVEFLSHTMPGVGLSFKPEQFSMRVHPGEMVHTNYLVTNETGKVFVGQAVPSITPAIAAPYFQKIECFCFSQQTLQAGETRTMPVVFVVQPEMDRELGTVTLSYTFFEAPKGRV